ncbi:MAG: outer membrane lipid asymmetry maintenance protein MlaD [Gammaproteobacteria bacterium]|jgi:phospholipid/cholesterol/gamma-HCH transport system substrate-binding protein|nr:outer membrane lipid asymmetry maintenance protein MlaD [Gammaproteobacteria bacterium]
MKQSKTVEIAVGLFVAAGMAALFVLAMKVSNLSTSTSGESYTIEAAFENIGGLKVRSPVTVSGVRVGRVDNITYDFETFEAVVQLRIGNAYDSFPEDTTASIFTAGLLGEQYIALEPGGSEDNLKPGDRIQLTQSALVLEQMIGQFLYNTAASEAASKTSSETASEASSEDN